MPQPRKGKTIPVNPTRYDPYKNFKFHIKLDGKIVAAVDTVSGIPRKITGLNKTTDITLKRGVIGNSSFSKWVNRASTDPQNNTQGSRKNLTLELHDADGQKIASWTLGNCHVSSFKPLASSDTKASNVAIASLVIKPESLALNT
jgi:phage tail-like protein